jgi:uncharacterized membrane protein YbhN (UPF0104 family)
MGNPPTRMALLQVWAALRAPWVRRLLSVVFFAIAAVLIYRQVSTITVSAFLAALAATNPFAIALSIVLTGASYLCLSGTEWLSLQALSHRLSYRQAAMVAIPAYALTNTAGFSPATGTALRLQLYARHGLSAGQSAAVAMLAGSAVSLSGLVAAGLLMVAAPSAFAAALHGRIWAALLVGAALLAPAGLWFWAFTPRAPRWLGGGHPSLPVGRIRLVGLLAGVGDWLFSGAALFALLPHPHLSTYPTYLAVYIAGCLLSAATGVPGGIGVFEAIVLGLSTMFSQVHETAAALLLYRCIYSLGPLSLFGMFTAARRAWRATGKR